MAGNVEQSSFISFVNILDCSSMSIPRKQPRNKQVTSMEELGTMSKTNLYMEDSLSYFILSCLHCTLRHNTTVLIRGAVSQQELPRINDIRSDVDRLYLINFADNLCN